jgi:hypothetical protein
LLFFVTNLIGRLARAFEFANTFQLRLFFGWGKVLPSGGGLRITLEAVKVSPLINSL